MKSDDFDSTFESKNSKEMHVPQLKTSKNWNCWPPDVHYKRKTMSKIKDEDNPAKDEGNPASQHIACRR